MYGKVLGAAGAGGATTAVAVLPNTGGNVVVSIAIAVAAGLVAWGVLYARSSTK
jgi:LPXTG-motif cell wall-anchored protein